MDLERPGQPDLGQVELLGGPSTKKLADYGQDDHPADDPERSPVAWTVAVLDDCDECSDLRVELTVEEVGRPGSGLVAHLSPATARRLHAALRTALREVGEDSPV